MTALLGSFGGLFKFYAVVLSVFCFRCFGFAFRITRNDYDHMKAANACVH